MNKEQFIEAGIEAGITREEAELKWPDFKIWYGACQKVAENPNWPDKPIKETMTMEKSNETKQTIALERIAISAYAVFVALCIIAGVLASKLL